MYSWADVREVVDWSSSLLGQRASLFLQLDRDVTPNNIGYKIYEGGHEFVWIHRDNSYPSPFSSKLSHLFGCMRDNFELKWIISPKILSPSKR